MVGVVTTSGCNVALGSGVIVGSSVFVAVGKAWAVCVNPISMVAPTWVKIKFISSVGAGGSGEAQALKTITNTVQMRKNEKQGF